MALQMAHHYHPLRTPRLAQYLTSNVVRDLAWSCFSPSMVQLTDLTSQKDSNPPQIWQCSASNFHALPTHASHSHSIQWLEALDQNPNLIYDFLKTKNTAIVGTYFESLWHFYLDALSEVMHLETNVQVFDDKNTVGEFDVLFFDSTSRQSIHLELAVKYYLGVPITHPAFTHLPENSANRWLGPQCRDRLSIKLHRLLDHQLKLSEHPAAQQQLGPYFSKDSFLQDSFSQNSLSQHNAHINKEHPQQNLEKRLRMTGILYYPFNDFMPAPENSHPNHQQGLWCHLNDLPQCCEQYGASEPNTLFWIKPKKTWLSPSLLSGKHHSNRKDHKLLTTTELLHDVEEHFQQQQYPLLIAFMTLNNETGDFEQYLEVFVTPNHWPFEECL